MAKAVKKQVKNKNVETPNFSIQLTDRELSFGVKMFGDKLEVTGTPVSQLKSLTDLERYNSLVSEVFERVELCDDFYTTDKCGETNECCVGPCYCN